MFARRPSERTHPNDSTSTNDAASLDGSVIGEHGSSAMIAVNVTGATPSTVAVNDCTPFGPSVQPETCATPLSSENAEVVWREPPPPVTANVTSAFTTALP